MKSIHIFVLLGILFYFSFGSEGISVSLEAFFSDTIGGANIIHCGGLNQEPCQENTEEPIQARWGVIFSSFQSGLAFSPVNANQIVLGERFLIGKLTHLNFPIFNPAESTQLNIRVTLTEGSNPIGTETFPFRFFINETLNQEPCDFPSIVPCADKIFFENGGFSSTNATFVINDLQTTFTLAGFRENPTGGSIVDSFISDEDRKSEAFLFARITRACPNVCPGGGTTIIVNNECVCDCEPEECPEGQIFSVLECECVDACLENCIDSSPNDCVITFCNSTTRACETVNLPNGADCSDSNKCTSDSCFDGQCIGTPLTCQTLTNPCQETFCLPEVGPVEFLNTENGFVPICSVRSKPDGTFCDNDNNLCTEQECRIGVCSVKSIKDCPSILNADPTNLCQDVLCIFHTGECVLNLTSANGKACSDGDSCTINDICIEGVCEGENSEDCGDNDVDTIAFIAAAGAAAFFLAVGLGLFFLWRAKKSDIFNPDTWNPDKINTVNENPFYQEKQAVVENLAYEPPN